MSNLAITPTGYYATGSSAVYHLLTEYRTTTAGVLEKNPCEHLPLYMPDGLFDMEDKLLRGNNIHRSDEALNAFYQAMSNLYKNNYGWYGNYKERFGPSFMEAVDALIDDLTEFTLQAKWYYDEEMKFSVKHTASSAMHRLKKEPYSANFFENITYKKKYDDGLTRYAFPTEEMFYAAAGKFIRAYLNLCRGTSKGVLLLDHFLLPQNLFRLSKYISEKELRVIVMNRDIRDVYVEARHRLEHYDAESPVPIKIEEFAAFMKRVREIEKPEGDEKQVLRIYYEDLFEDYEGTVSKVEEFCELSSEDHVEMGKHFDPKTKNKYMRQYKRSTKYEREIRYLEDAVPELLYNG